MALSQKNHMKLQCFICGETIKDEADISHGLDPCAVTVESNCDQNPLDRKSQVFWAHLICFKKVVNDPLIIELEDGVASEREIIEENESISDALENLGEHLINQSDLIDNIFNKPKGDWYKLTDLVSTENAELMRKIHDAEKAVFDSILIAWMKDKRLKENIILLMLSTDSYYQNCETFEVEY